LFFFFQAEDGIRDRNVTGVQTCALPISSGSCANCASVSEKAAAVKDMISNNVPVFALVRGGGTMKTPLQSCRFLTEGCSMPRHAIFWPRRALLWAWLQKRRHRAVRQPKRRTHR